MAATVAPLQYHASVQGGFRAIDFSGLGSGPWSYTYALIDKSGNVASVNADGSLNVSVVAGGSTTANATANAAAPSYVEATANPLSLNLTGDLRVIAKQSGAWAVTTTGRDLLYDAGTNGYIASLTLTAGADLASLASGGAVTLAGGGSAGVSSQSNTGSGLLADVVFKTVTAGFTPTAGGNISGWWLKSDDGGSTYETTPATPSTSVPALPRPPDFIVPLDAVALGTSAIKFSLPCVPPPGTFKCLVQNNSGAAFGAGNYTLTLRVYAKKN